MKKYEHLWQRYPPDTAAASSSWESPEPLQSQASTQLQTAQTLREWEQQEIDAVNRMTMDLLSTTADMESHMLEDDPISDVASIHDSAEATLERPIWSLSKASMCAISSPPQAQGKHFVGHCFPPVCAIQRPPSRWPSWLLVQESFVISGVGFAAKIFGASTCGNPQGHCVAAAQSTLTTRMRQKTLLNFSSLYLLTC